MNRILSTLAALLLLASSALAQATPQATPIPLPSGSYRLLTGTNDYSFTADCGTVVSYSDTCPSTDSTLSALYQDETTIDTNGTLGGPAGDA